MDRNTVLCYCKGVTLDHILTAMENGASSIVEVLDSTGAGSACGRCVDRIEEIVELNK